LCVGTYYFHPNWNVLFPTFHKSHLALEAIKPINNKSKKT
jgi:hypothetical protein